MPCATLTQVLPLWLCPLHEPRNTFRMRSRTASVGCAVVPSCWFGVCGVSVVAACAESASVFGIVRIKSLFDEVYPVEWVVVGDGGLCLAAEYADRIAREHCFTEGLVSACVVWVAVWSACLVGGSPALWALSASVVEVWAAGFGADAHCHRAPRFSRGSVHSSPHAMQ